MREKRGASSERTEGETALVMHVWRKKLPPYNVLHDSRVVKHAPDSICIYVCLYILSFSDILYIRVYSSEYSLGLSSMRAACVCTWFF